MRSIKDVFKSMKNNSQNKKEEEKIPLQKDLKKNIIYIKENLGYSTDLILREFIIGDQYKCALFIIDGLTNATYIYDYLLKPLMVDVRSADLEPDINSPHDLFKILEKRVISLVDLQVKEDYNTLIDSLLTGDSLLIIDGVAKAFIIETKGWADRGVTEATSQTVVRGPKDSFNETLRTNTMLIRRRLKDPNLRIDNKKIGNRTQTDVAIMYIKGIANDKIVDEVHKRLDRIKIDAILESSYIEQLIQDHRYSLFPTINNSERPDTVVASLLNGFVVILVDGTPYGIIVPGLFVSMYQTAEDYYHRYFFSTLIRLLRLSVFFIALLTPSIYIAITTFHQEMIPTSLLVSISNQREGIPFPAFIEALLMELTFEVLREAGIRMPRAVGSAVTVVGGLVLGEAAVQAGIVSSVMVIVVSLTAIASLITPSYDLGIAVRILRFIFMILAASFGLYGITIGLFILLLHLCSLRSFGVPYLYPIAPFNKDAFKDSIIRAPLWTKTKRPSLISQGDDIKQQSPKKAEPKPPKQRKERNR